MVLDFSFKKNLDKKIIYKRKKKKYEKNTCKILQII